MTLWQSYTATANDCAAARHVPDELLSVGHDSFGNGPEQTSAALPSKSTQLGMFSDESITAVIRTLAGLWFTKDGLCYTFHPFLRRLSQCRGGHPMAAVVVLWSG